MCVAVVKPKNVSFPTEEELSNCFDNNPNGAGFMYSNGEKLIIKKGFMDFDSFYTALQLENISEEKLVFLHFRIATHGLVDGGNTHPFPITNDIDKLRQCELEFDGYGLIHNGVFHYKPNLFEQYDPSNVISDTMLFAMRLFDGNNENYDIQKDDLIEDIIMYQFENKDKQFNQLIEDTIGYNKISIMNKDEDYILHGDWKKHNDVFYSNTDYESYTNYNWLSINDNHCISCQKEFPLAVLNATISGVMCDDCIANSEMFKCNCCEIYDFYTNEESRTENICEDCQRSEYKCDFCNKKADSYYEDEHCLCCESCYIKKTISDEANVFCNDCASYISEENKSNYPNLCFECWERRLVADNTPY